MNKLSTVLIIDDTPINLQVLSGILRTSGYDVVSVTSWMEASEYLVEIIPDLILLDIMMPEINGFDACKILKSNQITKEIPVIFISALTDVSHKLEAFHCGGVDYITKPFQKDEILERVKTHVTLSRAIEQLKLHQIELNQMLQTRDKFIEIISHDLKNPITALLGITELLSMKAQKYDIPEIVTSSNHIHETSKVLSNLLNNLLDWALMQKDSLKYEPSRFFIKQAIGECIDIYSGNIEGKNIILINNITGNETVYADINMLKTIIRNLLSNSIKFTADGGTIEISTSLSNESMVCIEIRDTGVGMNSEQIENLFNIKQNYSSKGTSDERGTGLGLVLCKDLVNKNGGSIWVDSILGSGSSFKFTLPV